jgi:uncharacterized protein (DUF488 family)
MTTIYTVGHSRHPAEHFAALLHAQQIALLVDVRSHPVSKWAPQFAKAALMQMLATHSIEYLFLGRELGGRPAGSHFYGPDGSVDYAHRAEAPDFKAGIDRLVARAHERTTAILCAEEDPARCHRRLLITPALRRLGIDVVHIRGDGRIEPESAASSEPPQLPLFPARR